MTICDCGAEESGLTCSACGRLQRPCGERFLLAFLRDELIGGLCRCSTQQIRLFAMIYLPEIVVNKPLSPVALGMLIPWEALDRAIASVDIILNRGL